MTSRGPGSLNAISRASPARFARDAATRRVFYIIGGSSVEEVAMVQVAMQKKKTHLQDGVLPLLCKVFARFTYQSRSSQYKLDVQGFPYHLFFSSVTKAYDRSSAHSGYAAREQSAAPENQPVLFQDSTSRVRAS